MNSCSSIPDYAVEIASYLNTSWETLAISLYQQVSLRTLGLTCLLIMTIRDARRDCYHCRDYVTGNICNTDGTLLLTGLVTPRSTQLRGERAAVTNTRTLVHVMSQGAIVLKTHCKLTKK